MSTAVGPVPPWDVDNEQLMTRRARRLFAALAPTAVALAWAVRGTAGAVTALAVMGFVLVVFASTAASLRWAARRGPTMVQATALGGALGRLMLYGLLAVTLEPTDVLDRPTLAVTAPLAIFSLLAAEVALVLANRGFRMIDPDAVHDPTRNHA